MKIKKISILFLLVFGMGIINSRGQSNEHLVRTLLKKNWDRVTNYAGIGPEDSLFIVNVGKSSPTALYLNESLSAILLNDGYKKVFLKGESKAQNGIQIENHLLKFSIRYSSLKNGILRKKKFIRLGDLRQYYQVIDLSSGRLLWSGELRAVQRDTLLQREVRTLQKSEVLFLRGETVKKYSRPGHILQIAFLLSVSIAVMVLFYSIRTT